MSSLRLRAFATLWVAVALAGCSATTPIVSQWRNPGYESASFRRILIGGLGGETSIRRSFEDEFVAQLRAAGIDAAPSYRYLADDEKLDAARLNQAAQKAGADAALFARSVHVEQKTEIGPSYFPYGSFGIFGSNVGASWHGLGGAPRVYRYNEYVSEATLYDVAKNEVVWTGTIKTTEPQNVRSTIRSYVKTVMDALGEKRLLQTDR